MARRRTQGTGASQSFTGNVNTMRRVMDALSATPVTLTIPNRIILWDSINGDKSQWLIAQSIQVTLAGVTLGQIVTEQNPVAGGWSNRHPGGEAIVIALESTRNGDQK